MPYRVNVVQGHFAADLLAEALDPEPGGLLVHDDLLSCGPIAPCSSLEEWEALRTAYWDSLAASRAVRARDRDRELLANLARLRDADSIVLWLGIGSAEQLLLVWMVQLLARIDVDVAKRASLIQFPRPGDRNQEVWSIGLLNAGQIRAHPASEPLLPDAVSELDRCWTAITSPDPAALLALLAEDSPRVPHLRPALRPLVDRYPDRRTGLGRWDAELLKYVATKGPRVVHVIAYTMAWDLGPDLVGEAYLFSRLHRLADARLPRPLVTLSGDRTAIRACEVALTDAGAAVLAGEANAVELNGIDDWVLGVHLDSGTGAVWYRQQGRLVRAG